MVSTKPCRLSALLIIGLLIGPLIALSGCTTLVDQQPSASGSANGAAKMDKRPNPYWAKQPRVDANAEAQFEKAVAAMENGELDRAEQLFSELHLAYPKLSGPLVNTGIIHYRRSELEMAESSWIAALEINSLNFDAYTYLGLIKREQGLFDAAESIYKKALRKWPDNNEMHCNLGILYDLYIGEHALALQEYLLCEQLSDEPSRQLRGWIVDLERRTQAIVNYSEPNDSPSTYAGVGQAEQSNEL